MNEKQIDEAILRTLAVHECGHWIVADHFDIPATVQVLTDDEGEMRGGLCSRDFPGTPFQASVFGWAGIVAEHVLGAVCPRRTPLPWALTGATIHEWVATALFHIEELSDSDRRHILGYWDPDRSARLAFQILDHDRERLDRLARALAGGQRPFIEARMLQAAKDREALAAWQAAGRKISIGYRAQVLRDHLSGLAANDPARANYEAALQFLQRGEEPPASLFEKALTGPSQGPPVADNSVSHTTKTK